MANINYATLAKEINGVIEYIYPKTVASIVEYTSDQTVEEALNEIKSGLGNVSSAVAADYYSKTEVDQYLDSLYSVIKLESVSVSPAYAELGSSKTVNVSWAASRKPYNVTVNGTDMTSQVTGETGSFSFSNVNSDTTYTVAIKDHKNNGQSKNGSIKFVNRVYWGASSSASLNSSDAIKGLSKKSADNDSGAKSRNVGSLSFNNQYFYYCYPSRLGAITATAGGLAFALNAPVTVSFTNDSGYTENYYVYRSSNVLSGSLSIVVS